MPMMLATSDRRVQDLPAQQDVEHLPHGEQVHAHVADQVQISSTVMTFPHPGPKRRSKYSGTEVTREK